MADFVKIIIKNYQVRISGDFYKAFFSAFKGSYKETLRLKPPGIQVINKLIIVDDKYQIFLYHAKSEDASNRFWDTITSS